MLRDVPVPRRVRERSHLAGFPPAYDQALAEIGKALKIQPEDATALSLKRTIHFKQHLGRAKEFERGGDYVTALTEVDAALKLFPDEREALALKSDLDRARRAENDRKARADQAAATARAQQRQTAPKELFDKETSQMRYQDVFQTQVIHCDTPLETAREAIAQSLKLWNTRSNTKRTSDIALITAENKTFSSKREIVLVVGQTSDTEVVIYYKLFVYTLGSKVQISLGGIAEESYQPDHPRFFSGASAPLAEKRDRERLQAVRNALENALREQKLNPRP